MKKIIILLVVVVLLGVAYKSTKRRAQAARTVEDNTIAVTVQPGIVSAGSNHIVAVSSNGDIYGWGANQEKELGLTDVAHVPIPTQLTADGKWRRVHTGTSASYAITAHGELRRRGFDRSRYGGRNAGEPSPYTYEVIGERTRWVKAQEAKGVGVGLDAYEKLWVWNDRSVTSELPALVYPLRGWADFCIANGKIYATALDGTLWRASNPTAKWNTPVRAQDLMQFEQVNSPVKLRQVYCREGADHVLALDTDGYLWGFGKNQGGELGNGGEDAHKRNLAVPETDMQKLNNMRWAEIAVGSNFTLGIRANGSLWAWGSNMGGQLGVDDSSSHNTPALVDSSRAWVAIAAGQSFAAAVTQEGEMYTWGMNNFGVLGEGGAAGVRKTPTPVFGDRRWGGRMTVSGADRASP